MNISPPLPTYEEYCRARAEYDLAIQPFLKLLIDLKTIMPDAFVIKADGTLEDTGEQLWPEWAKTSIAELESCIKEFQKQYFAPFDRGVAASRNEY